MPVVARIEQDQSSRRRIVLAGSLDTETAPELAEALEHLLREDFSVLMFDMAQLDYISSAGIREIFVAIGAMKRRGGRVVAAKMQPQIRKVFEIVKALPDMSVFASYEEMDDYLDAIQKETLTQR